MRVPKTKRPVPEGLTTSVSASSRGNDFSGTNGNQPAFTQCPSRVEGVQPGLVFDPKPPEAKCVVVELRNADWLKSRLDEAVPQ